MTMFQNILHQLWNQRRQNGWILLELIAVTFFLWTVIDPVCVLTGNRLIAPGFESEGRYVLTLEAYEPNDVRYRKEVTDTAQRDNLLRIAGLIRRCPEVADQTIVRPYSFPNCMSWSGNTLTTDTLDNAQTRKLSAQYYEFYVRDGGNLFRTYGVREAITGRDIEIPEDCLNGDKAFVSATLARRFYGTTDVRGKKFFMSGKPYEVAGVFGEFKHRDYRLPFPLVVFPMSEIKPSSYINWQWTVVFRLKDGVDARAFEKRFREEVAPQLQIGNFCYPELISFNRQIRDALENSGTVNKLRVQYALAGFALLCIFLGMTGTFWVRCDARRGEIGLMRSLGATKRDVRKRFLVEAWLLVTVAFLIGLVAVAQYVVTSGMADLPEESFRSDGLDTFYWQNRPLAHFLVVSSVVYVLLAAVSLVSTLIPVSRIAREEPADALRDE